MSASRTLAAAFGLIAAAGVAVAAGFAAGTPPEVRAALAGGMVAVFLGSRASRVAGGHPAATGGEGALWSLALVAAASAPLWSLDAGASWRWAMVLGGLACLAAALRGVAAAGASRWIARGLCVAALAHAAIGILHGRYAEDEPLLGGFVTQGSGLTAYGTFPNQGQFAAFLLTALGPSFVLAGAGSPWPDRVLGWATILSIGAGTWLSSSRAGVLGFVVAAAAGFVVSAAPGRRRLRLGVVGAAILALVAARLAGCPPVVEATRAKAGEARRFEIWKGTLSVAAEHPFAGVGFGAFSSAYPDPSRPVHDRRVTNAENEALAILAEGGFLGLAIAGLGVAAAVGRARRFKRAAGEADRRSFALGVAGLAALLPALATATPLHAPAIAAAAVLAWAAVAGALVPRPAILPPARRA